MVRLLLMKIDHASDFCLENFLCPLNQRIGQSCLLYAACKRSSHGCRSLSRALAWDDHEARGCAEPLQFLADDLLCRGVHREAKHLLADSRYFDAHTGGIQHPCGGAEQLRGCTVTGMDKRAAAPVAQRFDVWSEI